MGVAWRMSLTGAGFGMFLGMGLFFAPWIALAALVRQKDALARHQALEFDLQRSELQRQFIAMAEAAPPSKA